MVVAASLRSSSRVRDPAYRGHIVAAGCHKCHRVPMGLSCAIGFHLRRQMGLENLPASGFLFVRLLARRQESIQLGHILEGRDAR